MSIKIASMNFGDCDTILHNTPNGMKNIAEVLGPNGEVYWSSTKELTGVPPLSIKSNGTLLLDYLISGNMSQTGTPTPTTPIQPQETGERTGNLFDKDKQAGNIYVTESIQRYGVEISVEAGIYTVVGGTTVLFVKAKYGTTYETAIDTSTKRIITLPQNGYILIYAGRAKDYDVSNIMLNLGSTALPYEPYGYKIPISSAGQTNNIYLGNVQTTRRIKKVVFKGSENWTLVSGTHGFYTQIDGALDKGTAYIISSHYRASADPIDGTIRIANNKREVLLFDNYASAAEYKAFLAQQYAAGTPVTVWYVLATPTTGIVNEPLRKIGDYADTLSMEQAGVQIPTLHGNTVIDVETELKPSQMYIKYK